MSENIAQDIPTCTICKCQRLFNAYRGASEPGSDFYRTPDFTFTATRAGPDEGWVIGGAVSAHWFQARYPDIEFGGADKDEVANMYK